MSTTGPFSGAWGSDLERAKQYVRNGRDTKDGVTCPCCQQYAKTYLRPITSTMARWLIQLVRRWEREPRYYSTSEAWSMEINRGTGDVAKLRWWGLIETEPLAVEDVSRRASGMWRPTPMGLAFVRGQERMPSHARVYNNTVLALEGDALSIADALGTQFNYAELMNNSL